MSTPATHEQFGVRERGLLILAALVATLAMCFAAAPPKASAQTHYNFCQVTLAPYGQYGDQCMAWGGGYLLNATITTYERAGCLTVANGQGNLIQSWTCFPKSGGAGAYIMSWSNDGTYRKPVIRNNNLSFSGKFAGSYDCYYPC